MKVAHERVCGKIEEQNLQNGGFIHLAALESNVKRVPSNHLLSRLVKIAQHLLLATQMIFPTSLKIRTRGVSQETQTRKKQAQPFCSLPCASVLRLHTLAISKKANESDR